MELCISSPVLSKKPVFIKKTLSLSVLIHSLREWGIEKALNKFEGMWAFAWYKDNELVGEVIKFIEKDKKRPICSPLS